MKKIAISSGHGKYISGAIGPSPWGLHEHSEAVKVVDEVTRKLLSSGVDTVKFEDTVSKTQDENLNRLVDWHNAQTRDLDVSVHFNANEPTSKAVGTECWYMTQEALAADVASAIADAGHLKDRGPKESSGLFFLTHTDEPAILIETCFVDSEADCELYLQNFDVICGAIAGAISGEEIEPGPTPPEPPTPKPEPETHKMLKKGDKGPEVVVLQKDLGVLNSDGDFGSITDTWVRAFQAACGLGVDGVVGEKTWAEIDDLILRLQEGDPPLPLELSNQIYTMAQESVIADYSWPDRGVPPPGYIAGMALCFAYAVQCWQDGNAAAEVMGAAAGSPDEDALAWYADEFKKLGMSNKNDSVDTLRHLFVMMIGLGPRESSGKYCEGRDLSASNVASDTCEAGLFQTSWNIRSADSSIPPLLEEFWENPNGFLDVFREGISPTANNLNSYGTGDGVRYQFLSRFCPLFHVMVTAVGMRTRRDHWGPINRREVTIKKEADDLLKEVQALVEGVA